MSSSNGPFGAAGAIAAATASAAVFVLPRRSVFTARGADAERYLHGRITQDIKSLTPGQSRSAYFLNSQGRVLGACDFLRIGSPECALLIIAQLSDAADAEAQFLKSLLQFKVADDVTVERASPEYSVVSLQGPQAAALLSQIGVRNLPAVLQEFTESEFNGEKITVINKPVTHQLGFELIVPSARLQELLGALGTEHVFDEAERQRFRIWAGIPEAGSELTEKAIATEFDFSRTISFQKGCYVGQEVVEMSTARGRPNRKLTLLRVAGAANPGTSVTSQHAQGSAAQGTSALGKSIGEITSSAFFAELQTTLCLAFVKTSVGPEVQLFVGEQPAERVEPAQPL